MRYLITAPSPEFAGERCGVAFTGGQGRLDDTAKGAATALRFFERRGYGIHREEPEQPAEQLAEPQQPAPPARSASKADWVIHATTVGDLTADEAEKLTRDDLAVRYLGPKEA